MEFGAHLPVLSLAGEPFSIGRLTSYARAASQLGYTVLSANDHLVLQPAASRLVDVTGHRHRELRRDEIDDLDRTPRHLGRRAAGKGPGRDRPAFWRSNDRWGRTRFFARDYETVGVPFEERWKRFDELVPKLRRSWVQRTEIPDPNFPNGLCIVAYDAGTDGYTQHYFDSRGVVRLYAMTFRDGVWTLLRNSADFSPLDFTQRFTGRFSADGNTIFGTWETGDGSKWTKDFDLTYARVKR